MHCLPSSTTSLQTSLVNEKGSLIRKANGSKLRNPASNPPYSCNVPWKKSPCALLSMRFNQSIVCSASADENGGSHENPKDNKPKEELFVGEYGERVVLGEYQDDDEDMNIKLECDESGCVLVVGQKLRSLQEEKTQGYLQCGINGCFYSPSEPFKDFTIVEGAGWRLGFETAPESEDSFTAMVGAGGWSVALTASEFNDFTKLIQMLRKGLLTMDEDGVIGRDEVVMQVERGTVWMECTLPKKRLPSLQNFLKFGGRKEASAFEIRFVLGGTNERRQAEGFWPAEAVMDMLQKVDELNSSASVEGANVSDPVPEPVPEAAGAM